MTLVVHTQFKEISNSLNKGEQRIFIKKTLRMENDGDYELTYVISTISIFCCYYFSNL